MVNREPTLDELNGIKQDTVHWPAKAHRVTQVDESGNNINPSTEDKQDNIITELDKLVGFEIPSFDEVVLTYVAAGNGIGEIETVVYKASTVTVATLTLTYNVNNKLIGVVRS